MDSLYIFFSIFYSNLIHLISTKILVKIFVFFDNFALNIEILVNLMQNENRKDVSIFINIPNIVEQNSLDHQNYIFLYRQHKYQ